MSLTLGMRCRRGSQAESYRLAREARQLIKSGGKFFVTARFGADQYATAYTINVAATLIGGGKVTGTLSGTERNLKHGFCQATRVPFSAHD